MAISANGLTFVLAALLAILRGQFKIFGVTLLYHHVQPVQQRQRLREGKLRFLQDVHAGVDEVIPGSFEIGPADVGVEEYAFLIPTFSPKGLIPDSALWDEQAIVDVIHSAQQTLTLQFLSYSTSERGGGLYTVIDDAVRNAAKRGVKVKMIVSDWEKGSRSVQALKDLSSFANIEVAFTSIPEWSGGYIPFARVEHCKFIVADSKTFWLGSSNCEKSYYYSARNLGVVCSNANLATTLARIFLKSWNSPYKELITQTGEYESREHGEKR